MTLDATVPPVLLMALTAVGMWATDRVLPWPKSMPEWRIAVAAALVVLGATVALAGVKAFRRHRTTVNPTRPTRSTSLVDTGIYAWTRNPMYLGMLLILVGWAVWLWNPWGGGWLAAFVAYMNRFQIKPEEAALRQLFGTAFERYMMKVNRWV